MTGELQTWERRVPGTDVAIQRALLQVDEHGVVELDEALAAQLLSEAGWERTA
jgi:hypothetical protein